MNCFLILRYAPRLGGYFRGYRELGPHACGVGSGRIPIFCPKPDSTVIHPADIFASADDCNLLRTTFLMLAALGRTHSLHKLDL